MRKNTVYKSTEGKKKIHDHYEQLFSNLKVPYQERLVDTTYGKTFIIEAGEADKTPLFLFHGSCSNSAMWFDDINKLSGDYHVFAVDIIGEAGKSAETRLDLKTDDYAKWINELFQALKLNKAIFIGNSLGGWLSLKFATSYPEKVLKLVLLATSGITSVKLTFVLKSIFHTMRGDQGIRALNKIVYGTDQIPKEAVEFGNLIAQNFNPMLGNLPNFSDQQLGKLTMPVLYIAGENDNLLHSTKNAKRLKKIIPHVEINIIRNNGHVVYNVLDQILQFL